MALPEIKSHVHLSSSLLELKGHEVEVAHLGPIQAACLRVGYPPDQGGLHACMSLEAGGMTRALCEAK